jgi:hypothetical protein
MLINIFSFGLMFEGPGKSLGTPHGSDRNRAKVETQRAVKPGVFFYKERRFTNRRLQRLCRDTGELPYAASC